MAIPDPQTLPREGTVTEDGAWTALTPDCKRARVLEVAGQLFAEHGLEFPMPDLAKAVGVGVGTLYRQFGKKDDVIAALVLQKIDFIERFLADAANDPDAEAAFRRSVFAIVDFCVNDRVMQEAWGFDLDNAELTEGRARVSHAITDLVDRARREGVIRADSTRTDLSILFKSVRAAEEHDPGGANRLAELVLAGLRP